MARMRTIKPEFWVDDKIVDLSVLAKLLFIGLWNFADDEGYIEDSARQIKRQVFPDNDYDVAAALEEIVSCGLLKRLESDQGPLLHVVHFKGHQRPQHPTPTKFSNVHESSGEFVSAHEKYPVSPVVSVSHEDSVSPHSVVERRVVERRVESAAGKRGARIRKSFSITAEMRSWAVKETPLVDIDQALPGFIDYWTAVPGAKGVKLDWVSTWRNSMRRVQQFAERDRPSFAAGRTSDPNAWMARREVPSWQRPPEERVS